MSYLAHSSKQSSFIDPIGLTPIVILPDAADDIKSLGILFNGIKTYGGKSSPTELIVIIAEMWGEIENLSILLPSCFFIWN